MPLFTLICISSVGLMLIALWLMFMLILFRAIKNWEKARRQKRKDWLMGQALEFLEAPDNFEKFHRALDLSSREMLIEIFREILTKVRGEYAQQLVALMLQMGLVEQTLKQLRSRSMANRASACIILGNFNTPIVLEALERALDDSDQTVRLEALKALARLGHFISIPTILEKLKIAEGDVPLAVNDLFRTLGDDAIPQLIEILQGENSVNAKLLAADALSHNGNPEVVPALLQLTENKIPVVRLAAIKSLCRLDDPHAVPFLLKGMQDSFWEVRSQSALCAGNLGAAETIPALLERLDDEQWWVRYHAAEALFKLGAEGLKFLWQSVESKNQRAAEIAAGYLREKGLLA